MNQANDNLANLKSLLLRYWGDEAVHIILFGSRARGDAHSRSDADIGLLADKPIELSKIALLKEQLEESTIPYNVDIVDLQVVKENFKQQAHYLDAFTVWLNNLL